GKNRPVNRDGRTIRTAPHRSHSRGALPRSTAGNVGGNAVEGAILFPLLLGCAVFASVVRLLEGVGDLPIVESLCAVFAAVFGWRSLGGLGRGRRPTPPLYHVGRRTAFATVLTLVTAAIVFAAINRGKHCLTYSGEKYLTANRKEMVRAESRVQELERER